MSPAEPAAATRIRLCGPLRLEVAGRELAAGVPRGQAAAILTYMLSSRGFAARRDELIEAVLPGRDPQEVQSALRPLLSRLRRALDPVTIEGREQLRLLLPEPVWVDYHEAARAVRSARANARESDWESVRDHAAVSYTHLTLPTILRV